MEERDFNWCFNHESLFRDWLYNIYNSIDYNDLDNATIFSLWQKAKEYALEIASSKDPVLFYKTKDNDLITNFSHDTFLLFDFLISMLASSKNKNLETFANLGNKNFRDYLNKRKIDLNSIDELDKKSLVNLNIAMLTYGQIESDYDYSLPDGGITETITKTKTDETITKAITETESVDVILQNYNSFNNVDFISAMQKAIEKGWIEKIEDSRYKWIGPTRIGTKKIKGHYNSALAYFIAKALKIKMELNQKKSLTETSKNSIKNYFPPINDIKEVFGEEIKRQQLEDALERNKEQVWREVIDKFFKDIYNFIGN